MSKDEYHWYGNASVLLTNKASVLHKFWHWQLSQTGRQTDYEHLICARHTFNRLAQLFILIAQYRDSIVAMLILVVWLVDCVCITSRLSRSIWNNIHLMDTIIGHLLVECKVSDWLSYANECGHMLACTYVSEWHTKGRGLGVVSFGGLTPRHLTGDYINWAHHLWHWKHSIFSVLHSLLCLLHWLPNGSPCANIAAHRPDHLLWQMANDHCTAFRYWWPVWWWSAVLLHSNVCITTLASKLRLGAPAVRQGQPIFSATC